MVLPSFSAPFSEKATSYLSSVLWPPHPAGLPGAVASLQALPKSLEQTTHVSRMVADSKLPSDHLCHPLARPHVCSKAVGLGSPFQKLGHLGALLLAQARSCSRSGS